MSRISLFASLSVTALLSWLPGYTSAAVLTIDTTTPTWRAIGPAGSTPNSSINLLGLAWEASNLGWNVSPSFDDSDSASWSTPNFVFSKTNVIWLGDGTQSSPNPVFFRREFNIDGIPTLGQLGISVDDDANVWINGNLVFHEANGLVTTVNGIDVSGVLVQGQNVLAVKAYNKQGDAGLTASLSVTYTPVPEPNTAILGVLGLATFFLVSRRGVHWCAPAKRLRTVGLHCATLALTSVFAAEANQATAATTFTIDPSQSSITVARSGGTFSEQAPGSLTTSIQGSVVADITGSVITFPGGGAATLINKPGVFLPNSAPANVAGQATFLGSPAYAALRDTVFDLVGGPHVIYTQNEFFAAGYINFTAGRTDLFYQSTFETHPNPSTVTNALSELGHLVTVGNLMTLTIPIDMQVIVNFSLALNYTGQIVATAPTSTQIPEPSTICLTVVAGMSLLLTRKKLGVAKPRRPSCQVMADEPVRWSGRSDG